MTRVKKTFVLFAILSLSAPGLSKANCWEFAAQTFNVDERLLQSIAMVESGMDHKAVALNKNGTRDIGLMQINSSHLSKLEKEGINEHLLKTDPCISVLVGASILREMFNIYGVSWEAVGAYNRGLKKGQYTQRMHYARKVWHVYTRNNLKACNIPLSSDHKKMAWVNKMLTANKKKG